ncbi:selenocysteine-specific translation factor [Vallitalea longa]|uniref:Selenocysteine-specific elongation factor n=1 Tax=Vallitalea longa TaxID=2936439 RepID=A0A9W5YG08_9FIRM|nr:selenocysteine-specific translation elongation factor [Vallitalea longa]GKX31239.1 selenocysteine-specific translation factor [Vallitalea longa]
MDHLIIGTAGHVDHGKTELVKALTGYDTDRLKEEKRRGMTIELGFAPFMIDGKTFSIVDVPGHEKLVKTMVAGATGMDMALLIIAADEGIMPQTIEHVNILNVLDISNVIIVITKIDLVDELKLRDVIEDVKEYIAQTLSMNTPICPVSSKLNLGMDKLKNMISDLSEKIIIDRNQELFRMPIDRVFTIKGHGTVVTGTITGGKINKDSLVEILPDKTISKVRTIQVHGSDREKAYAGQRCAINLSRVDKSSINRGDVIGKPNELLPTLTIDTAIYNLSENDEIKHNQKVRINIGTTEVIGKLKMLQRNILSKNEKSYARIRLEKPIIAVFEDKFIIRSLSPVITLGGGKVLSHKPTRLPKDKNEALEYFTLLDEGNTEKIILYLLENNFKIFTIDNIFKELYIQRQAIFQSLTQLLKQQLVIKLSNKYYISQKTYLSLKNRIISAIKDYYKNNIYSIAINKETLRTKEFPKWASIEFDTLVKLYAKNNIINIIDDQISINDQSRITNISNNPQINELEKLILKSNLQGLNITKYQDTQLLRALNNQLPNLISFLLRTGKIVQLNTTTYIHKTHYDKLINLINNLFLQYDKITVQQVRDLLQIGRKQTIILLEYLDQKGLTKRINNHRILIT